MRAKDITEAWLQTIDYRVQVAHRSPTIDGVIIRDLIAHVDGRGDVTELWSRPWLDSGLLPPEHVYQSATDYGVVKCWHLHDVHTDQLTVTRGKLQLTLVDVREGSPSFGTVNVIFLGIQKPGLVKVPPGVMHGWKALTEPEALVVNLQSHVYTPDDEFKFSWDCVLTGVWEPKNG